MARDAYRFLVPLIVLAGACFALGLKWPGGTLLALAAFVAFFFRNPSRVIPPGENTVVSPADGRIVKVAPCDGGTGISIFLSVFNVHVNRSPVTGRLDGLEYRRGKFKAAFDDEASYVNEQNVLTISTARGPVVVRQIAGLIARRVICWKEKGEELSRGELIGLIRFGSRVDVVLPEGARVRVKIGDRVRGGSSVLAEYP